MMKISIITATRNSGATIQDTMRSILNQSYTDFEHIIIDGASTDNTMARVKELESLYDGKLKYISEPDKGLYDAMNKGLAMAQGDVVGLLNSDDIFSSPDVLEQIVVNISDYDGVYGDVSYIRDNNMNNKVRYYSSRRFRAWKMIMGFMPAHPSFYCRREVYNKYGNYDIQMKIASDFELLLRFIYINKIRLKYVRKNFVTMRIGGLSTSGLKSHKQILKDHMMAYRKNRVNSNYLFESCRYGYKVAELTYYSIRKIMDKIASKIRMEKHGRQSVSEFIETWQG